MIVYAYQRTLMKYNGQEEIRTDYSLNIEDLIAYYRHEKGKHYYSSFAFFKGELQPLMEIKIDEI